MSKNNVKDKIKQKNPDRIVDDSQYNFIVYNDDVTPFEYVILVLSILFGMSSHEGFRKALEIHQNGQGVVATLSLEIAYEKLETLDRMNDQYNQILQATVEKA